jgi:hypothetical protein
MEVQTTICGRIVAAVKGEVSTQTLEAYRRAGSTVHDLLDAAEARRLEAKTRGLSAWDIDQACQAQLLFTWNAFVLQVLADQFLDADYQHDPVTVGFVPPITAEQAQLFYNQVEGWLGMARRAESDEHFKPTMPLPAELPGWREADPCPFPHLVAMVAALKAIRSHCEAAMVVFEGGGTPDDKQKALGKIKAMLAEASSKAEYAERLMGKHVNAELHEKIEKQAQAAIEAFYQIGQIIAMPALADKPLLGAPTGEGPIGRGAIPMAKTDAGFDPWVMTDPDARSRLQRDGQAKRAIENMWRYDPDSRSTLRIQQQLADLQANGDIAYALKPNGSRIGHFMCTPYAPIFIARKPIVLDGERIGRGMEFTIEISAEGVNVGETFRREIVRGPFGPAPGVDYCDPNEKGPHDD